LIEKLKATRFLAVVGASGSGKSSLVRAGLIPILRKNALPDSNTWNIHVLTPGAHPLTTLAAHLARLYPHDAMHKTLDQLGNDERTMHLAVALALAERPAAERVVWVVDQFEEAFTLCRDERERAQFIANLLYAASIPDSHNIGVLTLRADFYPKCTAYPELSALIAAQQFLVSPMSIDGLRQAIEEPARRVGLEFEKGLVETILDDVENQPGALPLLEHALLELWERRHRGILTLEGYRDSGGVGGAIAKRADAIYNAFSPDQQAITRRIMLRLTQLGEGTEDTRRRAAMSELVTRSEESEVVESVVHALADARLVITSSDNSDEQWIDVSHEALIRGWPHLRQWIDEDRAGLRVHRRLTESAQEWQRLWHDQSVLYRGARLSEVMSWHRKTESTLNDLEYEFLNASIELQKREAQELERKADRDGQIRRELARELHDGPSQLLTAVIMGLKFLKQIIQRQPERVEAELDELERLITQALHQVRNMMFDLRPVALETQGLHAAIKLYSERQTKDSRLNLQVDPTTMDVRFPPEVESAAFSIIQEAVANARKHAHAKTILITVQKTEDSLVLTVRDDGRGFDLVNVESTYDQHVTFGLLNMREQAERCHGKLRIESKIGEGTQIILDIPLRWQI